MRRRHLPQKKKQLQMNDKWKHKKTDFKIGFITFDYIKISILV